ncbi:type IV secretion system protein VirB10 [Achromobacter mucicolens]|uniref:type IV secretion system protein VirB10 n=1 Tax=Achromobacter mucicolens TaxID=1389922 RepID=UPI0022F37EF1|nr:type IV secretion system protein VirB10 [Achromobacter mucicolens]WBX89174.1 type IV secretion system protein VirB10 [Achromobacter mucicolens]
MKFFKRRKKPGQTIDAVAEIEEHQAQIQGRGRPDLSGTAKTMQQGAKAFMFLMILIALMAIGVTGWRALNSPAAEEAAPAVQAKIENVLPGLKLRPEPPAPPPPMPDSPLATPIVPAPMQAEQKGAVPDLAQAVTVDAVTQRRLASGLRGVKGQEGQSSGQSSSSPPPAREADSGPMASKLTPMKLSASRAGLIGNRDMLITQGSMIDCVQETKLVTAQAGMLSCYAPHDIRSTSGRVVLIDKGSRFIGYQQGVLAQGQPRVGVVWSRLETPKGVVIHLDSPGTGPLGEAGLDGFIDTHFAERFGGAIMVSLISDLGTWATSRGSSDNGQVQFNTTGDAATNAVTTVLDNTINIPPTLYRNQGGRLGIYVARDLDFSSVYALRSVPR